MPKNECDESLAQNSGAVTPTRPLQSTNRPTRLGLCLSNTENLTEFRNYSLSRSVVSQESSHQPWTVRSVDSSDFEKLLGHLGNNGSTPVTPTSFLNPNNITEDQELFADNFSRTLNKFRAEQEGWSAISNSSLDGDLIETNSTFARQIQLNQSVSSPFDDSYTTTPDKCNSAKSQSDQIDLPLHLPNSSRVHSPNFSDEPLVLPSATSSVTHSKEHSGVNGTQNHGTLSECSSSTSDPFQENCYPSILKTSNTSHNNVHKTSAEAPWVSSLPTISSIANGLKQAVADGDHIPTEFCSDIDVIPNNSHFDNSDYSHDGIRSHEIAENVLTLNENDGINRSQKLRTLNACKTGPQNDNVIIHYAVQDNHSGVQLEDSCDGGIVDSLVASSSNSALCTNDSSDLGISKALNELYSSVHPTLSSVQECKILAPVPASLSSSDINVCSASTQKTPVHLYVGRQSNTHRGCSNHLLDNHMNPNSLASQSPASSGIHNGDSMLNRNEIHQPRAVDSHTNGIADSGNSLSQQFDGMYCNLGDHFSLPLSEADKPHGPSSHLIQSNAPFATTRQSNPCVNPVCETFMDAHMLESLRSPGITTTDLKQVTTSSHFNLTPVSSLLRSKNNDGQDQSNAYFRQLPICRTEAVERSSFPPVTSCLNTFPAQPLSLVTHSCLKKPKRQCLLEKRSRILTSNESSYQATVCDSSTDNISIPGIFNETAKSSAKPVRNLVGRVNSVTANKIPSTGCSDNYSVVSQQSYVTNSSNCFVFNSESMIGGELDDASDQSESLSTGTGRGVRGNTPVSSLDEVEQHHLKLERKRARNRVAARRCRERKITLIKSLENQVAERDAQVKSLEDMLARYRSEGERLRLHMEMLATSYPSLKGELHRFSFLFQSPTTQQQPTPPQQTNPNQNTSMKSELPDTP
ncbi:unnamed protein product [Trichobilharzia szidati]|nr:unnamed protein product [Trichobilharzia szidati]